MRGTVKSTVGWWVVTFMSIAPLSGATNDPRVAEAVKQQDGQAVRVLLKQKVDVNAPLPDGATALHWAVQWDDVDTVGLLIGAGARVNVVDDYGVMPLWLACTNGNARIVEKLLRAGADPNASLPTGNTVLMRAAHTGKADVVSLLLEHGAIVNAKENAAGQTALMWAAAEGHAEVAQTLVKHGADVHVRLKSGFTPFLLAARNASVDTARILLEAGASVNEAASDGTTALVVATIRGQVALARYLLEQGADPNAGPGFTPLHWAVGEWNVGLSGGRKDEDSEWSIFEGLKGQAKLELLELLLAHGANPNARAKATPNYQGGGRSGGPLAGASPFLIAASVADLEIMRLLLAKGADPSVATERKVTPLMAAAGVGSGVASSPVLEGAALEAIKLCVEVGNDVNAANVDGETALHGATYRGAQGSDSLIQVLVDKGANMNLKNKRGWTPLTIAEGLYFVGENTRSDSAAEVLRKLGAEPTAPGLDRQVGTTVAQQTVNR